MTGGIYRNIRTLWSVLRVCIMAAIVTDMAVVMQATATPKVTIPSQTAARERMRKQVPETETIYLSGRGYDDMVDWDFMCTGGRNAGLWTRIGVPSCWELQGFGTYQYGYDYNKWNKTPAEAPIADEQGMYRRLFNLPANWHGKRIEIVFEAVMTDAEVSINGKSAGEVHRGGFSPFRYDITDKVNFGDKGNTIEVIVNKESADSDVNLAERRCDYWNFGGIIRPVYIEASPKTSVGRVAIDADMNGMLRADCFMYGGKRGMTLLTTVIAPDGTVVGKKYTAVGGDSVRVELTCRDPELWTAETPCLYTAEFVLMDSHRRAMHKYSKRFGFRTVEIRNGDGLFINGIRVKLKGANRHSMNPESGRTLSYRANLEDVLLMKSLNMNAVRLSHYPADKEFYDICDSLGLYVIDELTGWQHPHNTEIGSRLVKELVMRDVCHPSVIMWASGNEGGFNYELEPEFRRYDIQKRTIIYPWSVRDGINTRHYRSYDEMRKYLNGTDVVMPTEFLHGLYDGGLGAGLYDYWQLMNSAPNCAGGFLWALLDEGVVRTDMGGITDTRGCFGPDGIVGPHRERGASYYTIKQIWSPVQVDYLGGGRVMLSNHYNFINLNTCSLHYRYLQMPAPGCDDVRQNGSGRIVCPNALPDDSVMVTIGATPAGTDVLELTVTDINGDSLFTWTYNVGDTETEMSQQDCAISFSRTDSTIVAESCNRRYVFSTKDGMLKNINVGQRETGFTGGPRLIAARRADRAQNRKTKINRKQALATKEYTIYTDSAVLANIENDGASLIFSYKGGYMRNVVWTFMTDGSVKLAYSYGFDSVADLLGIMFSYPEDSIESKQWVGKGPFRVWQNRTHGPQYGYWRTDYNDPVPGESYDYPEFKGYFADVKWMRINGKSGSVCIINPPADSFVGIYQPCDGRDNYLYRLPESGISILKYIPAVRNKVDFSDLNGPSAQPHWCEGIYSGEVTLRFE